MINYLSESSDDEFYDCLTEPTKYYAVAYIKDKGNGFVTPDFKELREKTKLTKGSRFIIVDDPLKAKEFACTPLNEDDKKSPKKLTEKKGIDTFPSLAFRELNLLKSHIEKDNMNEVKTLIESNPRYLISEADNPQLLQLRFRYNAIHVAASSNRPKIIEIILDYITSDSLWDKLYPSADPCFIETAKARLVDVYLNSPDIGNNETPLHFAAKFGYYDCIRELLRHKSTDKSLKNKSGQFAQDIICNRYNGEDKSEMTEKIVVLFSERYVALLDNRQVSSCLTYAELSDMLRVNGESVRAYIGPISTAEKADMIRRRWTCRNREDKAKYRYLRCSDEEKGVEAHGRVLANEYGMTYHEKWVFLQGKLLNFNSPEGLNELESFLEDLNVDDDESTSSASQSSLGRLYDSLTNIFSRMTLSDKSQQNQPQLAPSEIINDSLDTTRFNLSISNSGIITRDDQRVHQALKQTVFKSNSLLVSSENYPKITKYVTEMDSLLLNQSNASLAMSLSEANPPYHPSSAPVLHKSSTDNDFITSTPHRNRNGTTFPSNPIPPISPVSYSKFK